MGSSYYPPASDKYHQSFCCAQHSNTYHSVLLWECFSFSFVQFQSVSTVSVIIGTLSTVQLRFNLVADKINTQTQIWRDLFGAVLKKALIEVRRFLVIIT